jgi:hypothetical protein
MILRSTHTLAILNISAEAYEEIKNKLLVAGYDHVFDGPTIDMHGIGLEVISEDDCPGHSASHADAKICRHCGVSSSELSPDLDHVIDAFIADKPKDIMR